jgi:hypothetical protein
MQDKACIITHRHWPTRHVESEEKSGAITSHKGDNLLDFKKLEKNVYV